MFDTLIDAVTHLREVAGRVDVEVIDGEAAAQLVGMADEIRRVGDSLRTVAVGQVERTNSWRVGGAKSVAEWLAIKTDCAHHEAQSVVCLASQLQHLPDTQAALRSGELSGAQAVEVARGAIAAPNSESRLLGLAKTATVRALRDEASRVVAAATDEVERQDRIHKSRYLKSWTDEDGAFNLKGRMTVASGARILAALAPIQDGIFKTARKSGNHESPDAYAVDALLALCEARTTGSIAEGTGATTSRSSRPTAVMNIRVDYDSLKRGHTTGAEICEIPGVGSIPVAAATEYLGEAFLKLLVVDGTDIKTIAHMGRAIPAPLRTAIEERDQVCQVPTCDVHTGLEIDHIIPFADGGPASMENLVRLCARHHRQKTHDGYRLEKIEAEVGSDSRWGWRGPEWRGSDFRRPPDLRDTG